MQLLKRLALPALWLLLIAAGLFFILYFIRSKPQNNPASAEQKNDSGSAEQQKNPSAEPKNDSASAEQQKSPSTEHKNDSASAEQQKNPSTEHKNDSSPTAGPPQAGTKTPLPDNPKDMSQVVLMGNSCLLSLKDYSALPDSRIYAKVGLTVTKLLDCTDPQSAKTYSQIIESGGFEKLVIMVGENELGWNPDIFAQKLYELSIEIYKLNPGIKLYLHAITPISRTASDKNEYGANMQSIKLFNQKIKDTASAAGAGYIDPAPVLSDKDGFLPSDAAADGIHLEPKYTKIWADYLVTALQN